MRPAPLSLGAEYEYRRWDGYRWRGLFALCVHAACTHRSRTNMVAPQSLARLRTCILYATLPRGAASIGLNPGRFRLKLTAAASHEPPESGS